MKKKNQFFFNDFYLYGYWLIVWMFEYFYPTRNFLKDSKLLKFVVYETDVFYRKG